MEDPIFEATKTYMEYAADYISSQLQAGGGEVLPVVHRAKPPSRAAFDGFP